MLYSVCWFLQSVIQCGRFAWRVLYRICVCLKSVIKGVWMLASVIQGLWVLGECYIGCVGAGKCYTEFVGACRVLYKFFGVKA